MVTQEELFVSLYLSMQKNVCLEFQQTKVEVESELT